MTETFVKLTPELTKRAITLLKYGHSMPTVCSKLHVNRDVLAHKLALMEDAGEYDPFECLYLTTEGLARSLGLPSEWIDANIDRLPFTQIDNRVMFAKSDLETISQVYAGTKTRSIPLIKPARIPHRISNPKSNVRPVEGDLEARRWEIMCREEIVALGPVRDDEPTMTRNEIAATGMLPVGSVGCYLERGLLQLSGKCGFSESPSGRLTSALLFRKESVDILRKYLQLRSKGRYLTEST